MMPNIRFYTAQTRLEKGDYSKTPLNLDSGQASERKTENTVEGEPKSRGHVQTQTHMLKCMGCFNAYLKIKQAGAWGLAGHHSLRHH